MRSPNGGQTLARVVGMGSSALMVGRRYTPGMGAVETMEDFFEKLNGGDRAGVLRQARILGAAVRPRGDTALLALADALAARAEAPANAEVYR